jgi:hypothetical protein
VVSHQIQGFRGWYVHWSAYGGVYGLVCCSDTFGQLSWKDIVFF